LFNPTTKQIYTPNTNQMMDMGAKPQPVAGESPPTGQIPPEKGGDKNESGNQE
jgi:hypothetical protein